MADEEERLQRAVRKMRRYEAARDELHAAILAALDAGMKQADIVRETGYSRERIRLLDIARRPD